ncbi:MAG: hypothetical protein Roseis2KO_29630 [Roseivirga sp.]
MIKTISTVASALAKSVVETFITPKLQKLQKKWERKNALMDATFGDTFQEYLARVYEKNAVLNSIAFKKRKVLLSDVYQPLTIVNSESKEESLIEGFQENLFSQCSKLLITDTAGMGKSTIVKRLLTSCIEQNLGIPILIELRRLSSTKRLIDEILEQINPINDSIDKQLILDLIRRGDFIFFLDGFDEIPIDERNEVSKGIQAFISKANSNKFLLTSRPEDALSSYGDFSKYEIRPLKKEEAFELIKKYDSGRTAYVLIQKIQEPENLKNIKEYLTTPLLVSLLFTAFEYKQKIPFKKHIFYRQVYDALFESHDLSKGESFSRLKYTSLAIDEFHRVLRALGFFCFLNENTIEFTKDQLLQLVDKSISYCSDLEATASDFVKDIVTNVPLFSIDGVYYRWSHKSLQEYFAAQFIYLDSKANQENILLKMCFHEGNLTYLNTIDLYQSIDPIGFRNSVIKRLLEDFLTYIETSYVHFNGSQKVLRQQIMFGRRIRFLQRSFKSMKGGYHISSKSVDNTNDFEPTWLYSTEYSGKAVTFEVYESGTIRIVNFLGAKNFPFIVRTRSAKSIKRLKNGINDRLASNQQILTNLRDLELDKYIEIKDGKNLKVNKGPIFPKVNTVLAHLLAEPSDFVITIKEAKEYLKDISDRSNQFNSPEFLLRF